MAHGRAVAQVSRVASIFSDRWLSSAYHKCARARCSAAFRWSSECSERTCGVWVVNIETGQTVGFLRFEAGVQEIFAVQVLRGMRFPELLEWNDERLAQFLRAAGRSIGRRGLTHRGGAVAISCPDRATCGNVQTVKSTNLEIRNSKQIQMIKSRKIPNKLVLDFGFKYFVCFGFRDSDFGVCSSLGG